MASAMGVRCAGVLAALTLLAPSSALAGCPPPPGGDPALESIAPEARLAFLHDNLLKESRDSTTWTIVWMAGNAVLIAGTAGALAFYPKSGRVDIYVGIAATTIAALPLVLTPPAIEKDGRLFDHQVALLGASTDPCALIAQGEQLFSKNARDQDFDSRLLPRVINLAYNVAVGLVLGLVFNRWTSGGTAMFSGFTIGEIVLYTQPRDLTDEWDSYLAAKLASPPPPPKVALVPSLNGLSLRMVF